MTDLELLQAWQAGDGKAGNELLQRHFRALYRFFASKVPGEAEDLIQSTMLACVKYVDRVAEAASFRAYLFTIAANQLYAHLRKHVREGEFIDFTTQSAIDLGLSPSAVMAQREREAQLSLALRRLPLELQIVLELSYWEDMSAHEIATVLHLPLGTAKSKIRRAKQLLAEELARLGRGREGEEEGDLDAWVRSVRTEIEGG